MSDTESFKGDSSEEEMEEIDDEEQKVMSDEEKETIMKNEYDTEITVITGNNKVSWIQNDKISIFVLTKEVSWPPMDTPVKP